MSKPNLWAPWRMEYIRQLSSEETPAEAGTKPTCFLCDASQQAVGDDAACDERMARLLVLHRDEAGLIMLNRYPYTNGHLLVAPHEHVGDLADLSAAARAGLMELIVRSQRLLQTALNPQGMNVGINLGRCAGAGLPGHVHVHVVPRWSGDTNFMDVVGQVRVIPQALEASYQALRGATRNEG